MAAATVMKSTSAARTHYSRIDAGLGARLCEPAQGLPRRHPIRTSMPDHVDRSYSEAIERRDESPALCKLPQATELGDDFKWGKPGCAFEGKNVGTMERMNDLIESVGVQNRSRQTWSVSPPPSRDSRSPGGRHRLALLTSYQRRAYDEPIPGLADR